LTGAAAGAAASACAELFVSDATTGITAAAATHMVM
jgi:hypothetical protein